MPKLISTVILTWGVAGRTRRVAENRKYMGESTCTSLLCSRGIGEPLRGRCSPAERQGLEWGRWPCVHFEDDFRVIPMPPPPAPCGLPEGDLYPMCLYSSAPTVLLPIFYLTTLGSAFARVVPECSFLHMTSVTLTSSYSFQTFFS